MRLLHVLVFTGAMLLCGNAKSATADPYKIVAAELQMGCGSGSKIFVAGFIYASGRDSRDGEVIAERLSEALSKIAETKTVGKEERLRIFEELHIQRFGIAAMDSAREMAGKTGADCVVIGNLAEPGGGKVELNARALKVNSGERVVATGAILPRNWTADYAVLLKSQTKYGGVESKDAKFYYERGKTYLDLDKYDEAAADFREALSLNRDYWEAVLAQAYAYYRKQDLFSARLNCMRGTNMHKPNPDAYYLLGFVNSLDQAAFKDEAIKNLDEVVKMVPDDILAHKLLAAAYNEKGEYDKAIGEINRALLVAPKLAGGYTFRAYSYSGKKRYREAVEDCGKALEINPEFTQALIFRGFAYEMLGDTGAAAGSYENAIRISPDSAASGWLNGKKDEITKKLLLKIFVSEKTGRDVRRVVMDRLVEFRDDEVLKTFTSVYESDRNFLRKDLLEAIINLRNPKSLGFFKDLLKDKSDDVRFTSLFAIGLIGGKSDGEAIVASLDDPNPDIRRLTIGVLGALKVEASLKRLKKISKKDTNPEIQWAAARTVEKIETQKNAVSNGIVAAIDCWDLVKSADLAPDKYNVIVGRIKSLKKEEWPLYLRKVDDFVSSFPVKKGDESAEGVGWIMLFLYRPLHEIDELYAKKVFSDVLMDKTYNLRLRMFAMEISAPDKGVLARIASDPEEFPDMREVARQRMGN